MNYDLAKELKDAGFPQGLKNGDKYITRARVWKKKAGIGKVKEVEMDGVTVFGKDNQLPTSVKVVDFCKMPTLEELIEACGEKLSWLGHTIGGDWRADGEGDDVSCIGPTPAEAVARLWLALNKK